ncbi:MAG TPA: MEDS domain-containing protein [Thermoanaerobaculia bacterium]|nr:MEDS domain-containing protein [Thermoanaerobaculia bacterium]
MAALRILVADDHAAMRRSIRALIESHELWTVCAEVADGEEAVARAAQLRPDVAVVDYEMPKLSGIEVARQIRARVPAVQVLVLTMHDSVALHDEARRAGARDVIVKSHAERALLDAIEALYEIRLAGSVVGEHRHLAAFFRSEEERERVLRPFITEGLARGEKVMHIVDAPDHNGHDARLEVLPWTETYLRDDRFDQQATAAYIHQLLADARAEGYPRTRLVAHMEWAVSDRPGVCDLIEYEASLNNAQNDRRDVLVCTYDLAKFRADVVFDALRAHPAAIVAGVLRENPFYTPPDALLAELRDRA